MHAHTLPLLLLLTHGSVWKNIEPTVYSLQTWPTQPPPVRAGHAFASWSYWNACVTALLTNPASIQLQIPRIGDRIPIRFCLPRFCRVVISIYGDGEGVLILLWVRAFIDLTLRNIIFIILMTKLLSLVFNIYDLDFNYEMRACKVVSNFWLWDIFKLCLQLYYLNPFAVIFS